MKHTTHHPHSYSSKVQKLIQQLAVNSNRATEEITKISLATKCQSPWKKCSELANDCWSQRDAVPVNSQRYMQQTASPLNLPQMLLVGSYRKFAGDLYDRIESPPNNCQKLPHLQAWLGRIYSSSKSLA